MTDSLITAVEIDAYDPSRSNLLGYSRDFASGYWLKVAASVSSNAGTAPDNLALADKLVENSANASHYLDSATLTATSNIAYTLSIYAKAAGRSELRLAFNASGGANVARTIVNLSTGACSNATAGSGVVTSAFTQPLGGGWWRCVLVAVPEAVNGGSLTVRLMLVNAGAQSYLGDGASGVLLDRVLLEVGAALGDPIDTTNAGPGLKTLRFSTGTLVTGPADTPPHVSFDPRVITAPTFARKAFGDLRVLSAGRANGGALELANADHALAPLLDLGLAGRRITVRVGPKGAAYPGGFVTSLVGTVEQVEVGMSKATARIRDRTSVLDQPIQATLYAGTNSGSPASGAEGTADDIKGQPKPDLWGRGLHIPAVLVNAARLIYQVHSGALQSIDAVYDQGTALTLSGTNRANLAAMEATAPAAGQVDTCTSLGLIRLGSSPAGRVTVDAKGDATGGYVDRTGAIIRRILETRCGVATADINTTAFSAIDTAANYEVGIFVGGDASRRAVIDALRASVGIWVAPDRQGVWQAGQLVAPTGSPDFTFTDSSFETIERLATADAGSGVPVWKAILRYKRYWTGFGRADLAGALTDAERAVLLNEWRSISTEDAPTLTVHPLAQVLERDTLLLSATDAAAEVARLLALYKVRRDFVRLRLPLTDDFSAVDLGHKVFVQTPALGYSAGRLFAVLGVDPSDGWLDLDLWG